MRYSIQGATVEQVQAVGGTGLKEASSINIIFAELTEAQVSQLREQGCTVSPVGKTSIGTYPPGTAPPKPVAAEPIYTPSQLSTAMGFDKFGLLANPPLYGAGMNVAVVGTGIRETHQLLQGRVLYSKNFTTASMQDGFDHDTGVASIIVAIAPQATILNLKVMDDAGNGTTEDAALAIDWCIQMQQDNPEFAPQVINLSLGAPDDGNPDDPMRVACRAAIAKAIWILAAAGNGGPNPGTITSPATEKYVFAVGSCGVDPFVVSNFSSRGPTIEGLIKPDGAAFGENIILASSKSDTTTIAKSGTSFSTPILSGGGALLIEGFYKRASLATPISGIDPAIYWNLGAKGWSGYFDTVGPLVCVKPQGVAKAKDDTYGYGVPFGDSLISVMQGAAGVSIDMSSMVGMVMVVGMMGVMMKATGKISGKPSTKKKEYASSKVKALKI